jgi:hypothetical protein
MTFQVRSISHTIPLDLQGWLVVSLFTLLAQDVLIFHGINLGRQHILRRFVVFLMMLAFTLYMAKAGYPSWIRLPLAMVACAVWLPTTSD